MKSAMRVFTLIGLALTSGIANAAYQLNMKPGVTEFSQGAYEIHQLVMWICVGIGIVVFGAMIYSLIYHRKSKGAVAADFHESTTLEIVWTVIPFIILIIMAVPATKVLLAMEDVSGSEMSVKVTGYQWKWHYDYNVGQKPEEIDFFSNITTPKALSLSTNEEVAKDDNYLLDVDNPMVIPADTKVRLLFTSNDVIHSWWVAEFGVKKDTIPGFINESWIKVPEPGIYRGKCTELCGTNHGFMPVVVEVKSKEDYVAWIDSQKSAAEDVKAAAAKTWSKAELIAQGEQVYGTYCAACHQPNGAGLANVFPSLIGSPVVTGDIAAHTKLLINGVEGTAMQAFGNQLNDSDLAAVVTYKRNSWGNDVGDMIQPSEVGALR